MYASVIATTMFSLQLDALMQSVITRTISKLANNQKFDRITLDNFLNQSLQLANAKQLEQKHSNKLFYANSFARILCC